MTYGWLFNDTVIIETMKRRMTRQMNDELEWISREAVVAYCGTIPTSVLGT
jgi:hypothetical protein